MEKYLHVRRTKPFNTAHSVTGESSLCLKYSKSVHASENINPSALNVKNLIMQQFPISQILKIIPKFKNLTYLAIDGLTIDIL